MLHISGMVCKSRAIAVVDQFAKLGDHLAPSLAFGTSRLWQSWSEDIQIVGRSHSTGVACRAHLLDEHFVYIVRGQEQLMIKHK